MDKETIMRNEQKEGDYGEEIIAMIFVEQVILLERYESHKQDK